MESIQDPTVVTSVNVDDPSNPCAEAQVSWASVASGYIGRVYYGQGSALDGSVNINPAPDDTPGNPPTNSFLVGLSNLALGSSYVYQVQTVDQDQRTVLAQSNLALFLTPVESADAMLTHPHSKPRRIKCGQTSNLFVKVKKQRKPVAGASVLFTIVSSDDHSLSASGQGTARSILVSSDANGQATVVFTAGTSQGVAQIQVTSSNTASGTQILVVVGKK